MKNTTNRTLMQVTTVMTGVMVPLIVLLSIVKQWPLLIVAIIVELVLIAWSIALVSPGRRRGRETR